jgi:hypothetical protein
MTSRSRGAQRCRSLTFSGCTCAFAGDFVAAGLEGRAGALKQPPHLVSLGSDGRLTRIVIFFIF